jgi:rod shape determining protein RodA
LFFFFAFYDYRAIRRWSTPLYFLSIIFLIAVILWGSTIRGTTGWLGFGMFHVQPVEIVKIIMIIFLAGFFSKKKNQLSLTVRIIASVILVLVPVILILLQPDFGSAAVIVAIWAVMLVMSGINLKNFSILVISGLLVSFSTWFVLKDYQKDRLVNFVNPERDPRGSGYNVLQSIVAVGSGGIWGKGLGHGSQSQLNFLPEKHTDFIFAVISEELGFFGATATLILLALVLYRIKETARFSRDNFGFLVSIGIMGAVFFQIIVNVGMNLGVMPVAGVPLPFLSYGGSSLVSTLASMGIVQSVYMRRKRTFSVS